MIICPQCNNEIKLGLDTVQCSNCNYEISKTNGIWIFNKEIQEDFNDYNAEDLNILADFEENHFWFNKRREFILHYISKYIPKNRKIIEIGAGTSFIAKEILNNGYDIAVGDIHINGLEIAQKNHINKLYQFDIFKTPFKNEFDVVGIFDVIEHIDNEDIALSNVLKMLKPNGYIVLTVPAHKWLWGNYDVIANHKRRYSNKSICNLLTQNGFKIIESKNFFITLIPVIILRKILQKKVHSANKIIDDNLKINPLINLLFGIITSIEIQILKYLPCKTGASIIVIAQKEE